MQMQLSEGCSMCAICSSVLKTLAAIKKIHLSVSIKYTICSRVTRNMQSFTMDFLRRHQLHSMQTD